jgi:hypothetical protein
MLDGFDSYHFTLVLVAVITSVIAPILLQLFKHYLIRIKPAKKDDMVANKFKQESIIVDRLEKIRKKYNADRVWIAIFHNGSHTYTGKSLQKFSLTFESVKKGISIEGPNTQNLPTSLFNTLFKEVATNGIFRILDTTVTGDVGSNSLQGFFESRGIKSFLAISMLDIEDKIVGILCFDSVHDIITLNDQDVEAIKYEAGVIAGYLE